MKKFYSLLLSTLLLAVGGVEVEAQTLIRSWDFTKVSATTPLTEGTNENDTTYQTDINIDNIIGTNNVGGQGWGDDVKFKTSLSFKGKTEIHYSGGNEGSFLYLYSRNNSPKMRAGVRIPAPQGYIVKVTGYAESTQEAFTWVGAEIDTDMGSAAFPNNATGTVVGVAVSGEVCSRIKDYIAIENQRTDEASRNLRIYKIEVYAPNSDFQFQMPTGYNKDNYTVYSVENEGKTEFKGYLLRGENRTPLSINLAESAKQTGKFENTLLTQDMFKKWNGYDANATVAPENAHFDAVDLGTICSHGATVYGNSAVANTDYADITNAKTLRIEGTQGLRLRVLLNRQENNTTIELTTNPINSEGFVDVDLTPYEYVHINAIKINWNEEGAVTALILDPTDNPSVTYSCDCKGAITADINNKTGQISNIRGDGGSIVVKASYTDTSTGIINNNEYVITVPYHDAFEWDFETTETQQNLYENTSTLADWGLTWKVRRYNTGGDDNSTEMIQLSGPVLSNTALVNGDNARFIDATAGLIFESGKYSFGTNTIVAPAYTEKDGTKDDAENRAHVRDTYNSANNVTEDPCTAVTMQVGSKLIIPDLTPGQHIRIRWNRHDWNKGELLRAFNVTDLEGTSMHGMLFYSGTGSNKTTMGHQQFIVANEGDPTRKDGKVDVIFELVGEGEYWQPGQQEATNVKNQAGWINIVNIKVSDVPKEGEEDNFYFDTHMRPGISTSSHEPHEISDANVKEKEKNENDELVDKYGFSRIAIYTLLHNKTEDITTVFDTDLGARRSQAGRHELKYHIWGEKDTEKQTDSRTGTLTPNNCNIDTKDYATLHVKRGGHGNLTLVMESRQSLIPNDNDLVKEKDSEGNEIIKETNFYCLKPFLLDSLHINVKVYEYDYNVKPYPYTWAMEHFTGDTGNNSLNEINADADIQGDFHFWNQGKVFNVGHPENLIALKVKTAGNGDSKTVDYSVTNNAQQSITDNGTPVATLMLDDKKNYTIVPNYNASITLTANVPANKELFIREYGNEQNDVLIYRSGVLSSSEAKDIEYTFDVRKDRHYKIYSHTNVYTHESSQLNVSNISYTYYPNGGDEYFIPEFDGLGFFPMEYWDKYDTNVQLEPTQNGIKLTSKDKTYCMIVPNVKRGETVYLAVTDDEDNSSVAVGSPENTIKRAKDYSERVDVTDKIMNANFEQNGGNGATDDNATPGWKADVSASGFTKKVKEPGINRKSTELYSTETCTKNTKGEYENRHSFNLYQTLENLPAGTYELRAKAFNAQVREPDGKGYVEFYAKEGDQNGNIIASTPIEIIWEDVTGKDANVMSTAKVYSITFTINENKNVTIGFQTVIGDNDVMAARWFACDDFELWSYGTGGTKERQGYVYLDNTTDYNKRGDYHEYTPLNIYEINGYNNDMPIYLKNVTLHKVAVSTDNKNVSAAGFATEAREYPLDFTLANLFLGQEQKAYKVTGVDKTDADNPKVAISEVRYIPRTEDKDSERNNGVMISGDDLPEQENRKATNWPLFTTDVNRKMSDMNQNKLIGVVAQNNVDEDIPQREKIENSDQYYYNYMLALQGYNVKYDGDGTNYPDNPGTVDGEIKGLGFYLVLRKETDMGNGTKYQGGKPKDHSAYLQLTEWLARKNEISKSDANNVHKVFFIDTDSILTDIDEIPVYDDDELPTTDNITTLLQNGVFYTLQGVPVKNPTKGIYIFNGKKVYVK